jgi:glucosylglycerate hydrolase
VTSDDSALRDGAVEVLRLNDLGGWTRPAPRLYPHIWSWDSGLIAAGLAHLNRDRALRELETLFAAQWADGRVPHIVYDPSAPPDAYFPDPGRWACADVSSVACAAPATSGLVQPPVHAIGLWRIWQQATENGQLSDAPERARIEALYLRILAWHQYLATHRDPDRSGLLTIYHPWESGNDNSPRWDAPLANVAIGEVPPYTRRDLAHVADPSHRPTDAEYDRFMWLIESLKQAAYDDARAHRQHPFLVKDLIFSAILSRASRVLGEVAAWLRRPDDELGLLRDSTERFAEGVLRQYDATIGLALDLDVRTGRPIQVRTWAGLAPLLLPEAAADVVAVLVERMTGRELAGNPDLIVAAVPSTVPGSPGFDSRSYWRGPVWPIANWLLWLGLVGHGRQAEAAALRAANLDLLRRSGAHFAEYFEPFTGEPLGSLDQSWTAAVAIDWLATSS